MGDRRGFGDHRHAGRLRACQPQASRREASQDLSRIRPSGLRIKGAIDHHRNPTRGSKPGLAWRIQAGEPARETAASPYEDAIGLDFGRGCSSKAVTAVQTPKGGAMAVLDIADCINETCPWSGKPVQTRFADRVQRRGRRVLQYRLPGQVRTRHPALCGGTSDEWGPIGLTTHSAVAGSREYGRPAERGEAGGRAWLREGFWCRRAVVQRGRRPGLPPRFTGDPHRLLRRT